MTDFMICGSFGKCEDCIYSCLWVCDSVFCWWILCDL